MATTDEVTGRQVLDWLAREEESGHLRLFVEDFGFDFLGYSGVTVRVRFLAVVPEGESIVAPEWWGQR